MTRIGILGAGLMAQALGGQWAKAGHEVLIGARTASKAAAAAEVVGGRAGTPAEAAGYGEVTLLAVSAPGVRAALAAAGELRGPLIDCTNALDHTDFSLSEPAVAEEISRLAPGARVVKAFNLAAETVWRDAGEFGGIAVPLCGDDPAAVELVAGLVRDVGCRPVLAGGLKRARLMEATAAFAIGIWASGGDPHDLCPPLERAFGAVPPRGAVRAGR